MWLVVKFWPPSLAVLESLQYFGTLYDNCYRAGIKMSMILKLWLCCPSGITVSG